jgi:hypothetical protein
MEPCQVEPREDGNGVKCLTHRTDHLGHTAKFATDLTTRAEQQRRAWDLHYGYWAPKVEELKIVGESESLSQLVSDAFPVNSVATKQSIEHQLTVVNRLQETVTLWVRTETGEEVDIVALAADKVAQLAVEDGSAFVLRAEDSAVMGVIPPVFQNTHKVVL